MNNIKVFINGKTFGEIYLDSKYKKEPIEVKSWHIMKNNMPIEGSFELDKADINPSILKLFEI